ncbi:hypothetical protein HYH03_015743 [Edaphochlamys debaryana]|uniref:Uncharacterized protein n=1 Tax=Edaphochlamys debaryana TaxID=47281 RepID=A0A835XIY9_9CHLO|nr:hypothetical protein HYH03_015743 [Edaphochlamys debaryana]|eukprot:KAG2485582.1 hypothetical protein HYH03_015743 [Edaphochlamys debaryana]
MSVDDSIYGSGGVFSPSRGAQCVVATALQAAIRQAFPEVPPSETAGLAHSTVLFRGLRVRMGMHCGLGEAEVADNKASGRITYPGRALQMAKAVSDAGRGGHVTLSSAVLSALDPRPGHVHYSGPYLVLQGGKCVLKEGQAPVDVLCAFSSALLPRAGHMEGLRCVATKVPGSLQAPLGLVAIALAQVESPEDFVGWGLEASLAAHKALLDVAARLAVRHGGYLVHTRPGSFQGAFTTARAALWWLLDLLEDLCPGARRAALISASMSASQASLSVDTDRDAAALTRAAAMARLSNLVVKGGLDVGVLPATLGPTGEVAYAGTALKRATCLAANAAWHEILVSLEAVRGVLGEGHPLSQAIAAHALQQRRRPTSGWRRASALLGQGSLGGAGSPSPSAPLGALLTHRAPSHGPSDPGGPLSGQSLGVGLKPYPRARPQSHSDAPVGLDRLRSGQSVNGAAVDELLAEGVVGTLYPQSPSGGGLTPVRDGTQSQDVVFGPGLRLVKHKGAVLEACAVRRQGAAAAGGGAGEGAVELGG